MSTFKIGEIKIGREIGKDKYRKFIWLECPKCHKQRWADFAYYKQHGENKDTKCQICNGRAQGIINSRANPFHTRGYK
jgi:hypothetical protein